MEAQLFTVLLLCAAVVAGDIDHFPSVNLNTPENFVCPPNSQLEAGRNDIAGNISEILLEIAAILLMVVISTISLSLPEMKSMSLSWME